MNGAESLVETLLASGVDTCFANPGTSEMHFVAALDRYPAMKCVLGLHETVVTGAADGYARISGKPAATLLHLGPGLANGLANIHNARRGRSMMVNIVGDHTTYHLASDAPLTSDIESLARPMSHWVKTSRSSLTVAADAAEAVRAAKTAPGQIATLILPADTAWTEAKGKAAALEAPPPRAPDAARLKAAIAALKRGAKTALLIGDRASMADTMALADCIAQASGCRLFAASGQRRMQRGEGRVHAPRLPWAAEDAAKVFQGVEAVVAIGAVPPVSFFAHPGKLTTPLPEGCEFIAAARPEEDQLAALEALAEACGARKFKPRLAGYKAPEPPEGALTSEAFAAAITLELPGHAIVADESITTGRAFHGLTAQARAHDWIQITGGAIGAGMPLAIGAAVAAPGRPVLCLQADGAGAYCAPSLWTMAREKLHVVTVIFANRAYKILQGEMANVGALNPGRTALDLLSLDNPPINWVLVARGFGVAGEAVETAEDLCAALRRGFAEKRPYLIEAVME